ncbi:uncharacterized protein N7496_004097 [Penicillium cataractarum]|uniref:Extracellular membrane protein CFEM domain-containing protein n=1 Tax=Penicillium cataractarum TaxID=2100454 RepID=A0A9W9VI68_9EURO|nr:uncharacterized protein N7496_004097 [Penicillium cataractarum]KAJ5381669.1 hypothetical protein N7496_004097 [Penicillium cataractarum]
MARYLSIFLLLTLFSHNVLGAVVPKSDGIYDESLEEALNSDAISGYEPESEDAFISQVDSDWEASSIHATRDADAAANLHLPRSADDEKDLHLFDLDDTDSTDPLLMPETVEARAPADCNNLIRSGIDSCKRAVQSGIAACKKKIIDDVAACHIQVRQDIDKCKKKAKDPFTKGRCELQRKPRDLQCESRRSKIPTCEKSRPKVLVCCEGLRTRVQALCAAKVVSIEAVRNGLQLGQQQCIRGLII